MPILALVGNKGGAGKTTLCVNLASGLRAHGSAVILDADPQRSSLQWRDLTEREDAVTVIDAVDDIAEKIRDFSPDFDYLIVDCPPSVHADQTGQVLSLADIAIVPVQPSPLDLWATVHIEEKVEAARVVNPGLKAVLVINQLEPRTRLSQMVRQALAELSLPAAQTAIRRRMAYRTAVLEGRSVLEQGRRGEAAAEEIRQLIEEVVLA